MNISNKIKALIQIKGKKNIELAKHLGFSTPQALGNKLNRGSFSAEDLIKIADFLDSELAFIMSDGQKISLTMDDIRESTPTKVEHQS